MSFDFNANSRIANSVDALHCLNSWKDRVQQAELGSMTINRKGELFTVRVSLKNENVLLQISKINLCHTCSTSAVNFSNGARRESHHYELKITGYDANMENKTSQLWFDITFDDKGNIEEKSFVLAGFNSSEGDFGCVKADPKYS